jgi:radical SAM superfamily enzyme YgiQ (UPF0313 family)
MELPIRKGQDAYLPDGTFTEALQHLRQCTDLHGLRIAIVYAFDFRTRMLPYWYADKRMAPCSVRMLGDILDAAGFKHIRIVLQQWTPRFKPSQAILDGKPLDMLLVSAMQVHAEPSYDLIRDAHTMGAQRPLVLAGGPKAIYEPTDYIDLGPKPGIGADCVVTGEGYVLLELLNTLAQYSSNDSSIRSAFSKARSSGALNEVPGLVYRTDNTQSDQASAVNTGVQRLLRDLDETPMPDAGYRLIEPPHRKATLSAKPCSAKKVGRLSAISSVISTHGCKFACSYCPIPAVNQRTWRHKSPTRLADEIAHIYETFGIIEFFSTDDNFFNTRDTVVGLMSAMAEKKLSNGTPLGKKIRFYTEATEFDVYKNRDLLPLCKKAGLSAIWFGIEDITADLVNKGQTSGKTSEIFDTMHDLGIEPMAMMIHSDGQPLRSSADDLTGLIDQARYLFDKGAVSYQCTYLCPAVGTKSFEEMAQSGLLYRSVGGASIPQAFLDGNHVVASTSSTPWTQQMNVVRAYASFYNPINTLRIIRDWRKTPLSAKRLLFQVAGQIGLVLTAPKLWRWSRHLKRGPIERYQGLIPAEIPMVDAHSGKEVFWAIEKLPTEPAELPTPRSEASTDPGAIALHVLEPALPN